MYYRLDAGARLYRVTSVHTTWPTPLLGLGAYFTQWPVQQGGTGNRLLF
jgi:hypothetical protein